MSDSYSPKNRKPLALPERHSVFQRMGSYSCGHYTTEPATQSMLQNVCAKCGASNLCVPTKVPTLRFPEFTEKWQTVSLGDLLTLKNGFNADKLQYGRGIKYISVNDIIRNNYITYADIENSVDANRAQVDSYRVNYGDILFQRSSETREEVGQANVYLDEQKAIFGGFVIRGKAKAAYDPRFINYLLRTTGVRKDITSRSGGSTRYNIGQDSLAQVKITLPSLSEQQKIAAFLATVDEELAIQQRKIDLLKRYKKGVAQALFSQKVRLKDEHGGEFPEWQSACFKELVDRVSAMHNPQMSQESYKTIELESLDQGTGKLLQTFPSDQQRSIKTKFIKGDVLYGKLRPYLRKFYFADFDGVATSEIWVLRPKSVDSRFLYYLVQTDRFSALVDIQSGSKMPRADWSNVSKAVFAIPTKAEQQKIAGYLTALDDKISREENKLEQAKRFKKALLKQLFV